MTTPFRNKPRRQGMKLAVLNLHYREPHLTACQIAERLDCGAAYVRVTARREMLTLPAVSSEPSTVQKPTLSTEIGLLPKVLRARGRHNSLSDIQRAADLLERSAEILGKIRALDLSDEDMAEIRSYEALQQKINAKEGIL